MSLKVFSQSLTGSAIRMSRHLQQEKESPTVELLSFPRLVQAVGLFGSHIVEATHICRFSQ